MCRGAALPGWREGWPSLLQHLWNLPGTLCRYNAGSQPSSQEQLGELGAPRCLLAARGKCQVTPEVAPGTATIPGQGHCTEVGTAEEEPPQPRHQAEMGPW